MIDSRYIAVPAILLLAAGMAHSCPIPAGDEATIDLIRAAYLEQRDADAVVLADRALAETPSDRRALRGEIHFWRGASLRRLKRFEEALVALDVARDVGFDSSELHFERALTLRALDRMDEAQEEYQEAEKRAQDDPITLEELRRRWREAEDGDKKFQLRIAPQFGYDSNVVGVSDDALLAEEVDRESFYYGLKLSARYALYEEKDSLLALQYQNNLRAYASESDLSFSDNMLSATWHSNMGKLDWLAYELRASLVETFLYEDGHFRTQRVLAPALIFRPDDAWQIRLWGDWTDSDYYESTPDAQDRDGSVYRAGLLVSVDLGDGWKLAPHATYWKYNADGSDFDHDAWDLGFSVTPPEFAGLLVTLGTGFVFADYDNPHSLTDFTESREDRRFFLRLSVTLKLLEKPLGFAPTISLAYENWSSNISVFDFDRWDFGFSTEVLTLSF